MNNNNKRKQFTPNPLEILKDGSREAVETVKNEIIDPFSKDIISQIFGEQKRFSGEIMPGESVEMREVYSGRAQENEEAQKKLTIERRLVEEEKILVERRTSELRIQIQAIHEEIIKLAEVTPELSREVDIAAFQVPIDSSTYELYFLERLFEYIRSFRKKIEDAHVWLSTANRRARKKNMWGQNYKKYGAKYLLSGEHYLSRSAA